MRVRMEAAGDDAIASSDSGYCVLEDDISR